MADFTAVLRKTLDGMANPTPDMRAKVYERARATIMRQIDAMPSRPPESAIERQFEKLDAAIAEVEASYGDPAPAREPDDLDHMFAEPAAEKVAEPSAAKADEPAPPVPEPEQPHPQPDPEPEPEVEERAARTDPLEAFLAEQEAEAEEELVAEPPEIVEPTPEPEPEPEPAEEPSLDADLHRHRGEPVSDLPEPEPKRRGGLVLAAILLLIVIGGGYAAYTYQDEVMALFGDGGVTETTEGGVPVRAVPTTTVTSADTATDGEQADAGAAPDDGEPAETTKFTQRLTPDGNEVDEGPANAPDGAGEGTSVAGQTPGETAAPDAGAGTDEEAATAGEADAGLPVGQRAIFYQERTGSQAGTAEAGATVWSVVQESPGGDAPLEPAIKAEASIPELGMTMEMTIRRNSDETFPASHVIELFFRVPETFEGRGIADVQRITFKASEQDPGNALIGVAAPLDTNIFLIALTDADTAIETNLSLMQRQEWIDIPMQYVSGRRALITLEKGIPGAQVFDEVINSWKEAAAEAPAEAPAQ